MGRPDRLVVISGQSNNGYRLMIADQAYAGERPERPIVEHRLQIGPYAFKVMMEALTGKMKLRNITSNTRCPGCRIKRSSCAPAGVRERL